MGVLKIADKATDVVVEKSPRVLSALNRVKFFIFGLPIIGALIGIGVERVVPEKYIMLAHYEIGSVFPPGRTEPLDLAEEKPLKSRLRGYARQHAAKYNGAVLLTIDLNMPVVKLTARAAGREGAEGFLKEIISSEVAFENSRYDMFVQVFKERKELLERLAAEQTELVNEFDEALKGLAKTGPSAGDWFALQWSRARAIEKRGSLMKTVNDMKYQERNDLIIGPSELTRAPRKIVSSAFYRPFIYGLVGFCIGLVLTILLCLVTVAKAVSR